MITENVSTLKINKLTQEQYDRELKAGNIDETAFYLTPDTDTVDQTFDPESENAQSGKAIAEALTGYAANKDERFAVFTVFQVHKETYTNRQYCKFDSIKYSCGYGANTYIYDDGEEIKIPKIGDMLICTQNGYIYKVTDISEENWVIFVSCIVGATGSLIFDPESYDTPSGKAIASELEKYALKEDIPVVERFTEGTSGIWTYRKWDNGTYECWCNYKDTNFNGEQHIVGELHSGHGTLNFPITFVQLPTVTYSVTATTGYDFSGKTFVDYGYFNYYVGSTVEQTSSCDIRAFVIGKWK